MNKAKTFTMLLLVLFAFSYFIVFLKQINVKSKAEEITENIENTLKNIETNNQEKTIIFQDGNVGILKIPSLEIEAPICEGTTQEVLKYTIRTFFRNSTLVSEM